MFQSIQALSDRIGRCERGALRVLVIALPVMILANVASRALRMPLIWIDELAILTMVWLAMIGLSLTLKNRDAVSVTLLQDVVSPRARKALQSISDFLVLTFSVIFFVLCYLWFDPVLLFSTGFNVQEFSSITFNFIYEAPTATLGVGKVWFWLILPIMALCSSIHALANLLRTLEITQDGASEYVSSISSGE